MKQIFKYIVLGCALLGSPQVVEAVPITGELNIGGVATLNDSHLISATGVTSFLGVRANAASSGVFTDAGIDRAPVTMKPFTWNPSSAPVEPLWSFTHDGIFFEFDLHSLSVVSQTANFLNITGMGTISSSHYESASGKWTFTISDSDGVGGGTGQFKFGFQSASTAAIGVPDGGVSAILLGFTFLGFAACRRKLA